MSGVEIAGIVLAVLPFFIEAGKAYASGNPTLAALHKAGSRLQRDEKLQSFYDQFWWETFELRKQTEKIVNGLAGLSEERKRDILNGEDVEAWSREVDVSEALSNFFASKDDYLAFNKVMEKVLELLSRLVEDETVHISKAEKDQAKMLQKLERFRQDRLLGSTSSSFLQRFKFWKKEKDRATCLKNLRAWNKRVRIVIDAACESAEARKAVTTTGPERPSSRLRILSQRLFTALWKCWACDCSSRHEARFCLASCGGSKKDPSQVDVRFDFLIAYPPCQATLKWREGTVIIRTQNASCDDSQNRAELERICDLVQNTHNTKYGLQLLVEDMESSQRIWRLNWREPQLQYLETKPAITFEMMLHSFNSPSLIERRRLALTFAYSLFQLHESPWLSQSWARDRIHFFFNTTGIVDLHRPYLSTSFDEFPSGGETPDLDRFHRNPGILRIGILLVEVHKWKPLESLRMNDDLHDGMPTPNTDMEVVRRVLGTLDDCFPTYRGAIDSCLRVPWVSGGSRVSLQDPETWNGVYADVIEPLEREVALGGAKI